MTRDKMIEALAKAIINLHDQDKSAFEMAAAVLDLCGPEPLVFREEPRNGWKIGVSYAGPDAHIMRNDHGWQYKSACFHNLEAAQAAAQDHATAAHWAKTPLGKMYNTNTIGKSNDTTDG